MTLPAPLVPYDFQEADIENLLAHDATGFVVAETGAGKSVIGIEVGLRSAARVILVIAPQGTHEDVWIGDNSEWDPEGDAEPANGILRQDPTQSVRVLNSKAAGKEALFDLQLGVPGWYIMTPQLFTRWNLHETTRPDLVIVDEAHMFGNRETTGSAKLRKLKARRRIVMSGTMVRNQVANFWALIRWVYENEMNDQCQLSDVSYRRWEKVYLETKYDEFAVNHTVVVGELVEGRIASEIPCYVQHFKRQECCEYHPNGFLSELPAPVDVSYNVELTAGQKKAIDTMEKSYISWLTDQYNERRALVAKLPIVAATRLRQMTLAMPSFRDTGRVDENGGPVFEIWFEPGCESPKADLFHERLKSHDEPYLALTSSEKFAVEINRRLNEDWGIPSALWTGKVNDVQRQANKNAFKRGEIRVLVATIESIGTGTDGLQYATNRLFWFERSRDLTLNIQTEGRADRRGQTEQVINEYALATGSMDHDIVSAQLKRRLALNKSLKRELAKERRAA